MSDQEPRRRDDIAVAELVVQFDDFVKRYERDQQETKDWREKYEIVQIAHTNMLAEIAPNYKRGMWVLSLIVVGGIGALVKLFSDHFSWR